MSDKRIFWATQPVTIKIVPLLYIDKNFNMYSIVDIQEELLKLLETRETTRSETIELISGTPVLIR